MGRRLIVSVGVGVASEMGQGLIVGVRVGVASQQSEGQSKLGQGQRLTVGVGVASEGTGRLQTVGATVDLGRRVRVGALLLTDGLGPLALLRVGGGGGVGVGVEVGGVARVGLGTRCLTCRH